MARRHTPRDRHAAPVVADALAGAFLAADDWQPAAMGRMAKRALADRRTWTVAVAEVVVRAYPERPADRPRALAELIAATEPFRRAMADPDRPPRVRTWYAVPTQMGARRWPVPPVDDLAALATRLGVAARHLDWFADRRSYERTAGDERLRHHHRRWMRTASGGVRLIEAPKRELKDLQRQVLHEILDRIPPHPAARGFRPGSSPLAAPDRMPGPASPAPRSTGCGRCCTTPPVRGPPRRTATRTSTSAPICWAASRGWRPPTPCEALGCRPRSRRSSGPMPDRGDRV